MQRCVGLFVALRTTVKRFIGGRDCRGYVNGLAIALIFFSAPVPLADTNQRPLYLLPSWNLNSPSRSFFRSPVFAPALYLINYRDLNYGRLNSRPFPIRLQGRMPVFLQSLPLIEFYSKPGHPCMNLRCHVYLICQGPQNRMPNDTIGRKLLLFQPVLGLVPGLQSRA